MRLERTSRVEQKCRRIAPQVSFSARIEIYRGPQLREVRLYICIQLYYVYCVFIFH